MTGAERSADNGDSDHPRFSRVVVALANPESAALLISMARLLVASDGGELGIVTIVTGDAEAESSADEIEALREVVRQESSDEFELELDARTAPAVARGILDYVSERRADLVVVGVAENGLAGLGSIVESVIEAVSCTAIAVRPGPLEAGTGSVIVGVDGTELSRDIALIGISLVSLLEMKVEAVHVRDQGYSAAFARAQLAASIDDLPGSTAVERFVVASPVVGYGLASRSDPTDIVVIGETPTSRLGTFMSRDTTQTLLMNSRATVVVVSPNTTNELSLLSRTIGRVRSLRPKLTSLERDSVVWST